MKNIIENVELELTDEQLETVVGGTACHPQHERHGEHEQHSRHTECNRRDECDEHGRRRGHWGQGHRWQWGC